MEFQEKLYTLRKQQGLSQEELANIVGVSRQAVQKWEAGTARPDLDNLMALAQFFGVTLDELVGLTERPVSSAQNGYYANRLPDHGAAAYYIPCSWHYEYKSKRTVLGLPLVHIHFADRGMARATGIIAIGNMAVGLVAIGGVSMGLVSLGAVALGLLGLGAVTVGCLVWGGVAAGVIAVGGCALGSLAAFGGLAVGHVAVGGCAVGDVALGNQAVGSVVFTKGNNIPLSPELWSSFCQAVFAKGFGYRTLARILSLFH